MKGPAPSWLIWCMVMLIEPSAPRAGRAAEAAADMAAGTLITPAAELQCQRVRRSESAHVLPHGPALARKTDVSA